MIKRIRNSVLGYTLYSLLAMILVACSSEESDTATDDDTDITDDELVVNVNASHFLTSDGTVTISTVPCTLSDGTSTDCYQIVTNNMPSDHNVGPWCPDNISDDAEAGGIWLENGEVYDVDGAFIENMATFYNDSNWLMYDANGDVYITESEEDCINAANPDVGTEYENFCVECLPSYITDVSQTFLIPITPVAQANPVYFITTNQDVGGGGVPGGAPVTVTDIPSTRGIALNGIEFSAPAPTDNILSAYTLAPFDDAGGHINVHQGYHYHAATGFSTKVEQEDGHAALIGYAMDGYGIYENADEDGSTPSDLDDLRGHSDETRGYHYHIDEAGNNNFINGLHGAYAN